MSDSLKGKVVQYKTDWGHGVGVLINRGGLYSWEIITKGGSGIIAESSIVRVFTQQEVSLAVYEKFVSEHK